MEFENLLTLIKTVSDSELTDFDYEENGTRIRLKKKKETVVVSGASSNVPVMGLENIRTVENVAAVNTANTQADNKRTGGNDRKISSCGNFLCSTCRGRRSVCFCWRSGQKRSDACHRGSNETDERD